MFFQPPLLFLIFQFVFFVKFEGNYFNLIHCYFIFRNKESGCGFLLLDFFNDSEFYFTFFKG